jgi:hypothetical protein
VISTGLIIRGYEPFEAVIRPIATELESCYWLFDIQAGTWRLATDDLDTLYDEKFVRTDTCDHTSMSCWRPGTIPKRAAELIIDEWSYLFAMRCEESDVERRAAWLSRRIGKFDEDFFAGLEGAADAFFMHVEGWWEIYVADPEWRRMLRQAFPSSAERTYREVGRPPSGAE